TKTQCNWQQIAPKLVQLVLPLNKNSFFRIYLLLPFCIKTNLRENRFFGARWAIGEQKGLF
ncbi:MAG: hypothetical protein ACFNM7_06155, partial [Prevotella conceptionensis]